MLYMICATDVANSLENRLAARPAHLARLNALKAEFESLEAAQAWADADPYIEAGVYESVIVKPYKKVLP